MEQTIAYYITLTTGLTQLIKLTLDGYVSPRLYPLFALIIGVTLSLTGGHDLLTGIVIGLSANGLYSGIKKTIT